MKKCLIHLSSCCQSHLDWRTWLMSVCIVQNRHNRACASVLNRTCYPTPTATLLTKWMFDFMSLSDVVVFLLNTRRHEFTCDASTVNCSIQWYLLLKKQTRISTPLVVYRTAEILMYNQKWVYHTWTPTRKCPYALSSSWPVIFWNLQSILRESICYTF